MKARTRILALLMALLTVFGTMWIPSLAAEVTEATLTVTPEGGTTTTYNGTYQEMHQKLVSLAPTVKTEYKLTLNKDAAYTTVKGFTMNENVYLTIDLNGYTLDVSKVNSNIYTITGSPNITIDGADDEGNLGTILNRGSAGGLFYTQNKDVNAGFVGVVQNVYMLYTNMAQGYNVVDNPDKDEYPNQPMMHLNKGDVTMKNVHLTYTGEDAFAVVGSQGSPEGDISKLTTPMVTAYGTTKLTIEDCSFIDTNTKGIKTKGINASCNTVIRNTVISAYDALTLGGTAEIYDSVITGTNSIVSGACYASLYNCELNAINNASLANNLRTVFCEGTTINPATATGRYAVRSGFEVVAQENGTSKVVPKDTTEAALVIKMPGTANGFYSGTYQAMHEKLASLIKTASTTDAYYEIKLMKDSAYTKHYDIVSGYTDGATATVVIDYNGHNLLVKGNNNNIYTIYGTTTGYYNFNIDGADDEGNIGTLTCVDLAGGLVFTRGNNGLNANTTVTITNLNCLYTNMAQGIANESPYPNQPMLALPAGKLATLKNLHMTYTGEDATAMEGKLLKNLRPYFISASGVEKVIIEDCSFIDTNTKGIKVTGLNATGNGQYLVKNTEIKGFYGIASTAKHMDVVDSKITASYLTYAKTGVINVTDTVSVAGTGGDISEGTGSQVTFLYGEGKNTAYGTGGVAIKGSHTVQSGFPFVKGSDGVYVMTPDTTVEASLAVIAVGVKPTFTTGSYNTVHASIVNVAPTVPTKYVLTLTKDALYTAAKSITMNANATLVIDLDGHKMSTNVNANLYQVYGGFHLVIDGSDKDGNRGMIYSTGNSGAIVYLQNKAGNNNDKAIVDILDIELYYTNLSQGYGDTGKYPNQPMANIPVATRITYDNVKITYSGEDAKGIEGSTAGADLTKMYTTFLSMSGNGELIVNDCEFVDTNEKGITVRGIILGGNVKATVTNTKIDCDLVLDAGANNKATVQGCEFTSDKKIFAGKGQVTVSDTTVRTEDIFSGNAGVVLCEGNTIYTKFTDTLTGYYSVHPEAIIVNRGNGLFTVENKADETIVDSGSLGDNAEWKLTGSGILKISGVGAVSIGDNTPWLTYSDIIDTVDIASGITSIGEGVFADLTAVTNVFLPDTLKMIGNSAFAGCSALTDIIIPASVAAIGKNVFADTALTTAKFASADGWTVDGADVSALDGKALAEAFTATYANSVWFKDAEATEQIASGVCGDGLTWTLGNNGVLTVSGSGAMYDFEVDAAPWNAYKDSIFAVVFEDGVTSVGRAAFFGYTTLTRLTLSSTMERIELYAFYGCVSLGDITIPASVNYIGVAAFRGCSAIEAITFEDVYGWTVNGVNVGSYELTAKTGAEYLTTTRTDNRWYKTTATEDDATIKVGGIAGKQTWTLSVDGKLTVSGKGKIANYKAGTAPWSEYAAEITEIEVANGITYIGRSAFYGLASVTKVTLPETLEGIGDYAFYGCASLSNIVIPYAVTEVAPFAFRRTDLRSATFECVYGWSIDGVEIPTYEMVGSTAANYISKLNYGKAWTRDTNATEAPSDPNVIAGGTIGAINWTLSPDGVLTFTGTGDMPDYSAGKTPWEAFKDSVTAVVIENGITSVGRCAFYGFGAITEVTLPEGLVNIDEYAFYACSALETVTIPASTRTVGYYAFRRSGVNTVYFAKTAEWRLGANTWLEADYVANAAQMATNLKNGSYKEAMTNVDGATTYVEIMLDGKPMEGYDPDIYNYTVNIDINTEDYKTVTVKADSEAQVITVSQATFANKGVATVTVTNGHGTATKTYTVTFTVTGTMNTNNAIVNKDGASATVTYVIDDGQQATGSVAKEMLSKYDYLTFTFAIHPKDFATLTEVEGADGKKEYVFDENGNYVYTQTDTQKAAVAFWADVLSGGKGEIASHSMTHAFWGTNDDGGTFEYVKNNSTEVLTATMPKGSTTKELIASKQIIGELFPSYLSTGFIIPGISVRTSNYTTADGKVITTYNTYFTQLLQKAILDGVYTSARATFQSTTTDGSASRVILPSKLDTINERMAVPAYMIVTENANGNGTIGDGIENWTAYIDHAIAQNGWACYCIHNIAKVTNHSGHYIHTDDADALFAYTADKNVWVATYTDASTYYMEWSTATVTTAYENGKITVTLTDKEDNELFNAALTVKVAVPSIWDSATVNGEALEIHKNADGTSYVYVNIVPDTGAVSVIGG